MMLKRKKQKNKLIIDLDPFLTLKYKDFFYFDERELIHAANQCLQSGAEGIMLHISKNDLSNRRLLKLYQEFIQLRPGKVFLLAEVDPLVMKKVRKLKPDVAVFYRKNKKNDFYFPLNKVQQNEVSLFEKIQSVGTQLCFFIQADADQVAEAYYYGADAVLIDCSKRNLLSEKIKLKQSLREIESWQVAKALDLQVYMGRGLTIENTREMNADGFILGHHILQKSILTGLKSALKV